MNDQDKAFHEWTPCEFHGHEFLNSDANRCAPDEPGRCRDCGEPNDAAEQEAKAS